MGHAKRVSLDSLKRLSGASPWRPFTLQLADGRALRVPHPDFITLTRSGRTAILIPEMDGDEFYVVDVLLIRGARLSRSSMAGKQPRGAVAGTSRLRRAGAAASIVQLRTRMDFIWFILIGLAAGWLAGKLIKGRGFGLVGNLIIGVIGALVGGLAFRLVGLKATGLLGSLVTATAGALLLLWLLRFIKR